MYAKIAASKVCASDLSAMAVAWPTGLGERVDVVVRLDHGDEEREDARAAGGVGGDVADVSEEEDEGDFEGGVVAEVAAQEAEEEGGGGADGGGDRERAEADQEELADADRVVARLREAAGLVAERLDDPDEDDRHGVVDTDSPKTIAYLRGWTAVRTIAPVARRIARRTAAARRPARP